VHLHNLFPTFYFVLRPHDAAAENKDADEKEWLQGPEGNLSVTLEVIRGTLPPL